ncbi:MAG: RibD family protein [Xenococcaceae cyanobacterium MO_188.B19]|nr:RibD family protein [Xenococcaceae cyanobacterium MO_188.B19]
MKSRPQTIVILAMTADGKIADFQRSPARFGSRQDKNHLEQQIAVVDGVIFGAETLRSYGTSLPITNKKLLEWRKKQQKPPQPIHFVCSASGKIDPKLKFFSQPIPRCLITTKVGAKLWEHQSEFERVLVIDSPNTMIEHSKPNWDHWETTLYRLQQLKINKLAILGGGELVGSLFQANLVDELWLTVCPVILGGKNSPTPVEGRGFLQSQAIKLKLIEIKQIEQEIFLHYSVNKSRGK